MDLGNGTRVRVRLPASIRASSPSPSIDTDNPDIRVGVENLLKTSPGRVFVDHGAPADVEFPSYASEGSDYIDLDTGNWYTLGADMQWVEVGNVQGPPGDTELSPEELQAIVDDAEAEVLAGLEPPVDLTILFYNSLA